jgi:integrase
MARKPQVRYFASRNAYYTQWRGKQHPLAAGPDDAPVGPTYLAALDAFKGLMALETAEGNGDCNSVRVVLELYLQHIASRRSAATLEMRQAFYREFCREYGEMPVGELRHLHIFKFCDAMRKPRRIAKAHRTCSWGDTRVAAFIASIDAAFNWASKPQVGLITRNPVKGCEKPRVRSRSRDCLVGHDQHQCILSVCHPRLREFVVCLQNTGCRPGELAAATAGDFNAESGAICYFGDDVRREDEFAHKTANKGKDRTIFFTGEALAIVRRLVQEHPTGTLFRTRQGNAFSKEAITEAFAHLRRSAGMPAAFTAYSYRHSLATAWLSAGRPVEVLAELLGNSPRTIWRHYSHLCGNRSELRRHLEEFQTATLAAGK